jgi:hypothetical protein
MMRTGTTPGAPWPPPTRSHGLEHVRRSAHRRPARRDDRSGAPGGRRGSATRDEAALARLLTGADAARGFILADGIKNASALVEAWRPPA